MIHTTHYTPQGLPLFPVPFPVGIGRKHLMDDDMRQYAKAGRAERTKKESLSRAEQAQKRMEASEQKYKAALDGSPSQSACWA